MPSNLDRRPLYVLIAIVIGIIYGTLFPLTNWSSLGVSPIQQLFSFSGRPSYSDLVVNVFVYVPLGLAVAFWIGPKRAGKVIGLSIVFGLVLSFTLELMQAYLPNRVTSISDLVLNTLGASLGGFIGVNLSEKGSVGRYLLNLRSHHCKSGAMVSLGLLILGLWAASQLIPFVPSLDVGNLKDGLKPIAHTLAGTRPFSPLHTLVYTFSILALAIIARACMLRSIYRSRIIFTFFVGVPLLKIIVVGRQLSLEACLGILAGYALFRIGRGLFSRKVKYLGAPAVLLAITIAALRSGPTPIVGDNNFNWIPFRGHVANDLIGIADLIEQLWPMFALAYFAMTQLNWSRRKIAWVGSVVVGSLIFWFEWQQRHIIGRLGDITDAFISAAAFFVAFHIFVPSKAYRPASDGVATSRNRRRRKKPQRLALATAVVVACFIGGALLSTLEPTIVEERVDESKLYQLPAPEDLPPVSFNQFNFAHPRLPHPSADEVKVIRRDAPKYFERSAKKAKGGAGGLDDIILTELVDPGSQDLQLLHDRLINLEFEWRGNVEVKPIVLAYDWLYHHWSPQQRNTLLSKSLDGCEYLIQRIRESRLSPYNVFLYNSPLQALIACGLVTYGENERADLVMRFVSDMWKNRVHPVWKQVMGKSGGWHEGGEYVGIGIGQAIYQIPHMWQTVTNEDYFRQTPGIRGFLDFLVYRTRPDGTHFRWGDGGYFDRGVPDQTALATKYRHAAAFSSGGCPQSIIPGSWPWAGLNDSTLCDVDAEKQLPLAKLFDGTGMLVARSSWSKDATYVTFKAGNNYWSHSHLDQGAFTIFKGTSLALDSGIYAGYGNDHHMNYAYQTIAHNMITVRDPEDVIPAPKENDFRSIANDGGQRRVGSGWGVEGAPMDITEWRIKRDIYNTGEILEWEDGDKHVSVLADLTAAYTNALSGRGTFSHRTYRVEKVHRRFLFDRELDMVLVLDNVAVAKPQFVTRWNLHSTSRPQLKEGGFEIREARPTIETSGTTNLESGLTGHILLPKNAFINTVGGPGFEFFVDGQNYDEKGKVFDALKGKTAIEPGEWRIEVEHNSENIEITFLVLLFPWTGTDHISESVDCEYGKNDEYLFCTITANNHTAEYQISAKTNNIIISRN